MSALDLPFLGNFGPHHSKQHSSAECQKDDVVPVRRKPRLVSLFSSHADRLSGCRDDSSCSISLPGDVRSLCNGDLHREDLISGRQVRARSRGIETYGAGFGAAHSRKGCKDPADQRPSSLRIGGDNGGVVEHEAFDGRGVDARRGDGTSAHSAICEHVRTRLPGGIANATDRDCDWAASHTISGTEDSGDGRRRAADRFCVVRAFGGSAAGWGSKRHIFYDSRCGRQWKYACYRIDIQVVAAPRIAAAAVRPCGDRLHENGSANVGSNHKRKGRRNLFRGRPAIRSL